MGPDDRDCVLASIRAALGPAGTGPRTCVTAGHAPAGAGPQTRAQADLLASFVRMSEDALAPVTLVASFEDARARLSEILRKTGARSVVVSPDAAREPWSATASAGADGRRVVDRREDSPAREALLSADAGVTVAAFALADTGTLALYSSAGDHRLDSLLPPVHVALVCAGTLVPDLAAAFARLADERRFEAHSGIIFVRGPSRTADIELTLTVGVHGPRRAHVIVVNAEV